jgi:hypothetical protein
MSKFAILTTLAIYATALALVPMVAPAQAATINGKHIKKHKRTIARSFGFSHPRFTDQAPVARPAGGSCRGSGRSFECATWPPPFDEDPDRKASGTDGGD